MKAAMVCKVVARRGDAQGSLVVARAAQAVVLGTDLAGPNQPGRQDAFNPVSLLLAAPGACMIKGVKRGTPVRGGSD